MTIKKLINKLVLVLVSVITLSLLGGFGETIAAELRRPLSVTRPMYFYHVDTWNGADPQKVIDLIPEYMREYVVVNISMSVTESVTKDGFRTSESWLRTAAENRMWAMIQPSSGGHSWFSDYEFSVYRYFFENYPNFLGFNYCEQFWGFDDADGLHPFGEKSPSVADRMNLFANLLDICDEYGGYLCISNCLVIPEWDSTSPLTMYKRYPEFAAKAKEHKEHLIYCEKYTMSANFYDMESMCLGVYLSDYCGYYGMRFDQCGYHMPDGAKFPDAIGGMMVLEHMMMTGQTVQDGPELIWQQCVKNLSDKQLSDGFYTRQWELYPQFENVYGDVWRKFTTDGVLRIMPRQELIDSTRVAVYNDISEKNSWYGRRAAKYLFTGLYAIDEGTYGTDSMYLKKTGRYPTIPTIFTAEDQGFERIVKQSQFTSVWGKIEKKQEELNSMFAPQTLDESDNSLYVRHIDNNWLFYNNSQYEDKQKLETSTIGLLYNSCSTLKATMPMYSFGVVTEKKDGIDLYLNNYRSASKQQSTDVIEISGCSAKPTFTVAERGYHDASTVESTYDNGTLTLRVTHNGALDIAVKCQGENTNRLDVPEFEKTQGCGLAPVYEGPRQYEIENADYKNIDKGWNGATKCDISGFTALGYLSWGKSSQARVRDTIRIDESGLYKMSIRYLAPQCEVSNMRVYLNGKVAIRKVTFPQTNAENEWQTVDLELSLTEGFHEIQLVAPNQAAAGDLYLDNMIFTNTETTGLEMIEDSQSLQDNYIYNLQGIPVSEIPRKGIYIRNGKKIIL